MFLIFLLMLNLNPVCPIVFFNSGCSNISHFTWSSRTLPLSHQEVESKSLPLECESAFVAASTNRMVWYISYGMWLPSLDHKRWYKFYLTLKITHSSTPEPLFKRSSYSKSAMLERPHRDKDSCLRISICFTASYLYLPSSDAKYMSEEDLGITSVSASVCLITTAWDSLSENCLIDPNQLSLKIVRDNNDRSF